MSLENMEQKNELKLLDKSNADWSKFKAVRLEALKNEPQAFGANYNGDATKPDTAWQEALIDANREYAFLENNDEYVGMAGAYKKEENMWMIIAVYLRKEFRGQGQAEKIITLIENKLKGRGVSVAQLMVNKEQEQAVNFYRKLGYSVIGEENDVMLGDGKKYDEYVMQKNLG